MAAMTQSQQLIDAIESMDEGIALFDAEDRLVLCNEPFRDAFEGSETPIVPGTTFETMIRHLPRMISLSTRVAARNSGSPSD